MFTMVTQSTRKTFSAMAAVAIVSFGGLAMDQGYLAAAPAGTVEIGELTALDTAGATSLAQLPEVVVVARRESATYYAATALPEIVVVAKRVAALAARDADEPRGATPAIRAGF